MTLLPRASMKTARSRGSGFNKNLYYINDRGNCVSNLFSQIDMQVDWILCFVRSYDESLEEF